MTALPGENSVISNLRGAAVDEQLNPSDEA
jgi:hypothetical protein